MSFPGVARCQGFHTVRGVVDPGDHRFRSLIVVVVDVWNNFSSGDGNSYSPRVVLRLQTKLRVFTPCGAVWTGGTTVVVPSLLELYMYERISDLGMRSHHLGVALALRTPGLGF